MKCGLRQSFALLPRVSEPWIWISKPRESDVKKFICCRSIAFTYNDPVIFAEYAIDCAQAAHERGIKTVAVTAGYINPEPRRDFYAHMDAANVDLKAFTGEFYHKLCFGELEPVLDTMATMIRRKKSRDLAIGS